MYVAMSCTLLLYELRQPRKEIACPKNYCTYYIKYRAQIKGSQGNLTAFLQVWRMHQKSRRTVRPNVSPGRTSKGRKLFDDFDRFSTNRISAPKSLTQTLLPTYNKDVSRRGATPHRRYSPQAATRPHDPVQSRGRRSQSGREKRKGARCASHTLRALKPQARVFLFEKRAYTKKRGFVYEIYGE